MSAQEWAEIRLEDLHMVETPPSPISDATEGKHDVAEAVHEPGVPEAAVLRSDLDRRWFRANPDRNYRIRDAIAGDPAGASAGEYLAVRQIRPGICVDWPFLRGTPLPAGEAPERVAKAIFIRIVEERVRRELPMTLLEGWLSACELTPAEFGRYIGFKWPYSVRRYLQKDVNGRPRKDWQAPRPDIQFKIERLTRGGVKRADWAMEVARRSATTAHARSGTQACAPRATSEE